MKERASARVLIDALADFERTDACASLGAATRAGLRGSLIVLAREGARLRDLTAEQVVRMLVTGLPRRVSVLDAEAFVDGIVAFLIWAAKSNRAHRSIEYACRRNRASAIAAMRDERKWSPGTQMLMAAMRDGVDSRDLDAIRRHALERGMRADFVDEFLPPPPMCLANGEWQWLT